jgi:uncharacterized small protein (DUF1192 family)
LDNQTRQADQQLKLKLGVLKLMKDAELNQAKIHKLEAEAVKALEEAGGVGTNQKIALLNAEIAATKAKNDGIKQAIDTIVQLNATDVSSPEVIEPVPSEGM